jgi:hypothetical protein
MMSVMPFAHRFEMGKNASFSMIKRANLTFQRASASGVEFASINVHTTP